MSVATAPKRTDAVYLHSDDNICVAARNLSASETLKIAGGEVTLAEPIRLGHKIAVRPIKKGDYVRKYGQIIGQATQPIEPGHWVHSHNLVNGDFVRDYASATAIPPLPEPITGRTFQGYQRPSGKAGTRNYIAVISTVNCSATVSRYIAQRFDRAALREFPNIDGVIAVKHGGGCGIQYQGLQHEILNRTLAGMARHPNIGGYLLVGLGCEQATSGYLMQSQQLVQIGGNGSSRPAGPPVLSMQDQGGTTKTIEEGVRLLSELMPRANDV